MAITKNPKTGERHTAFWVTIMSGLVTVACIVGVSFGKLPPETLGAIVVPIIGLWTMAGRNKNG